MNGYKRRCVIKGVAFFNDKIDGEMVDTGSVFIEEQLDESTGRAKGFRTVEYRTPDSRIPEALIQQEVPGEFDVTIELVTSKRTQVPKVTAFEKVVGTRPNPAPMPKAA